MADVATTTKALEKIVKSEEGKVYKNFLDQLKKETNWSSKVSESIKFNLGVAKEVGVITDVESSALATLTAAAENSGEKTLVALRNFSFKLRILAEAVNPLKNVSVQGSSHYLMDLVGVVQKNNIDLANMEPGKMKLALQSISSQLADRYAECTDNQIFFQQGNCIHNSKVKF